MTTMEKLIINLLEITYSIYFTIISHHLQNRIMVASIKIKCSMVKVHNQCPLMS